MQAVGSSAHPRWHMTSPSASGRESDPTSSGELVTANEELQRFNRAAVGRELRMVELKKEVNELRAKLDQPGRYKLDFGEEQP